MKSHAIASRTAATALLLALLAVAAPGCGKYGEPMRTRPGPPVVRPPVPAEELELGPARAPAGAPELKPETKGEEPTGNTEECPVDPQDPAAQPTKP